VEGADALARRERIERSATTTVAAGRKDIGVHCGAMQTPIGFKRVERFLPPTRRISPSGWILRSTHAHRMSWGLRGMPEELRGAGARNAIRA